MDENFEEQSPQSIMQIAEQTPVQSVQKPASKKFLWIAIIAIAVVVLVILAVIMLKKEKNGDGEGGNGVVLKGSFEERLKTCLEEKIENGECGSLFNDPDAFRVCVSLAQNKDECFYRHALASRTLSTCNEIQNEELKNTCIIEMTRDDALGEGT